MITQETPSLSQLKEWNEMFFKNCPVIVNDTFHPVSKLGRMWYQLREKCSCGQRIITDPDRVRERAIQAIQPAYNSDEAGVPRMAHYAQCSVLKPFLEDTVQGTMIAFSKHILSKRHLPASDPEVLSYLKETFSMKDEDIVSNIEYFNFLTYQEKLLLIEKMPNARLHVKALVKEMSNLTESYSPIERSVLARSMILALKDAFSTLDFETKKDLIQFLLEDPSTKHPLIYSSIKKMSLDELQFTVNKLSNSEKQTLLNQLKGKLIHLSPQKRKILSDVKKELSIVADTTSLPQQLPASTITPFEEF